MLPLESLLQHAQQDAAAGPPMAESPAVQEAARMLGICNACRYCEGYCAVFPAMARRLEFAGADVHYLANLCHQCGACLPACQYARPHAFAVDVPAALAAVRAQTYADYAWPPALGRLYQRNGLTLALALAGALGLFLALAVALQGRLWGAVQGGNFYLIFPHGLMVALFAPVFVFSLLALMMGVISFWRGQRPGRAGPAALAEASHAALTLKYLGGGHGLGCNDGDDRFTLWRRRFHHATFYGFMLCFAATALATVYHYGLGRAAPYAWLSGPKLLGTTGGLALLAGCAGLAWLRRRRLVLQPANPGAGMDAGFIALLAAVAASGLLLAAARTSAALPLLLCLHLGAVLALFATLPYSKFAHGLYRGAALLKWAIERRQPNRLGLGSD